MKHFSLSTLATLSPGVNDSMLCTPNGSAMAFSPASSQTYLVIGTDSQGCSDSLSIYVQADSLETVAAGNGMAICTGQSISLTASGAQSHSGAK